MTQHGWSDVVIKPAIQELAVDTYRVTRHGAVTTLSPELPQPRTPNRFGTDSWPNRTCSFNLPLGRG